MNWSILRTFVLPRGQRLHALLLVLLQCWLMWQVMDAWIFPLLAGVLALAAGIAPRERTFLRVDMWRTGMVLVLVFLLKGRFYPHSVPVEISFIYSEIAYELASLMIALQVLLLWCGGYYQRLPFWFPVLGGLGIVFLGDLRLGRTLLGVYPWSVAGACLLLVLLSAGSRRAVGPSKSSPLRWRTVISLIPIGLGFGLGLLGTVLFSRHEPALEKWFDRFLADRERDVSPGFSGEAGLDSVSHWSHYDGDFIMVRVEGVGGETYLKGCAFDYFEDDRWVVTKASQLLPAAEQITAPAVLRRQERVFPLVEQPLDGRETQVGVWPEPGASGSFGFITPQTVAFLSIGEQPLSDANGNVFRQGGYSAVPYRLLETQQVSQLNLSAEQRQLYLQLPVQVDERVRTTAQEVFAGATSTRDRIQRLEGFFHANFDYHLGLHIPRHEDRLGYFLEHRLAAHCEYFAAATAILLRLEGVPTRFVTGYVAAEHNPVGNFWMARREDAHAWVEAYDDSSQQWILVESTPGSGVPSARTTATSAAWGDVVLLWGKRLWQWLLHVSWGEALRLVAMAMGTAVLLYSIRPLWKRGLPHWLWRRKGPLGAVAQELIHERQVLDRVVEDRGFVRAPQETIHQFADRIAQESATQQWSAQAAECYRLYATVRFHPPSRELLQQVQELRRQL